MNRKKKQTNQRSTLANLNFFSKNWRYLGGSPRIGNSSGMTDLSLLSRQATSDSQQNNKTTKDVQNTRNPKTPLKFNTTLKRIFQRMRGFCRQCSLFGSIGRPHPYMVSCGWEKCRSKKPGQKNQGKKKTKVFFATEMAWNPVIPVILRYILQPKSTHYINWKHHTWNASTLIPPDLIDIFSSPPKI